MDSKHKQKLLKPKLDRRNAIKNIDYDASTSDDATTLRTRSLDLSPISSRTSFRIQAAPPSSTKSAAASASPARRILPFQPPLGRPGRPCHRLISFPGLALILRRSSRWRRRSGGGGIKGVRPPPVLAPPPVMRRPVVDNVSSTWDLLKSFAPQGDEPLDSLRGGSKVASSSDEEDVSGIVNLRMEKSIRKLRGIRSMGRTLGQKSLVLPRQTMRMRILA
ncbi:hypothetical protein CK203_061453 [Vitis vinifera]|uniref:Uncharacterized protein n=1 Tax=Vitis vinifera TaxID=29760 RepID=A0A438FKJ9_VITVI|nr:hypothetical protein CK203_061453 [Vitis vinifera]